MSPQREIRKFSQKKKHLFPEFIAACLVFVCSYLLFWRSYRLRTRVLSPHCPPPRRSHIQTWTDSYRAWGIGIEWCCDPVQHHPWQEWEVQSILDAVGDSAWQWSPFPVEAQPLHWGGFFSSVCHGQPFLGKKVLKKIMVLRLREELCKSMLSLCRVSLHPKNINVCLDDLFSLR